MSEEQVMEEIQEEKDLKQELEELRVTIGTIRGLEETCQSAGQKVANAKRALKVAREEYDEAVMSLREAIREHDEVLPLFDRPSAQPVADDAWRAVTIEDAGIPENLCVLLREAKPKPIQTVGDIADFTSIPTNNLIDIQGIGAAKATAIDEALERFWQNNPQFTEFVDESGDEEEEDE